MGEPNWANLLAKGRVKAIGIPWNADELKAIYELGIPAEYVRNGFLTKESYENAVKGELIDPIELLPEEELVQLANEEEVNFVPSVSKETLVEEVKRKKAIKGRK